LDKVEDLSYTSKCDILIQDVLSSKLQKEFFKLIEKLPVELKNIMGYGSVKKAKRNFVPKAKSYSQKQKLNASKSVRVLYTPMGNKR